MVKNRESSVIVGKSTITELNNY